MRKIIIDFPSGGSRPAPTNNKGVNKMKKYVCTVCGYVYDPDEFDGVAFEDQPDDFVCPLCGVGKEDFEEE